MERILGCVEPRLFTPPLSELTPETSMGFDVIEWLENDLEQTLYPHQKWLYIHALEYQPGTTLLRFRHVLCLMARRNAKTHSLTFLTAYQMTHGVSSVLNSSASLDTARESFLDLENLFADYPEVFGPVKARHVNGQLEINLLKFRSRYKLVPANRRGGRGLNAGLAVADEIREMRDWESYSALEPTTIAVENSQFWMLSNAGDLQSIVLNSVRARALEGTDPHLFIAEWSAPDKCQLDDRFAWAQANPLMNRMWDESSLEASLNKPASEFRVENLCMSVPSLSEAIPAQAWADCIDPIPFTKEQRSRTVLGIDISPDGQQISVVAAVKLTDLRIRVEGVAIYQSSQHMRQELPDLIARIRPLKLAWFPESCGAIATDLKALKMNEELSGRAVSHACAELADLVKAGRIAHAGDPVLTDQIISTRKLTSGGGWKFNRRGGYCSAAYATAGAVHLARSLPDPTPLRLITPENR